MDFTYANLSLDGVSSVKSYNGLLAMTNNSLKLLGHAFYPSPLLFKQLNANNNKSTVVTFCTNFVFSFIPKYPNLGGHGLAFVLMSTKDPKGCLVNQFLGFPNGTGKAESSGTTGRILAVEFDVVQNPEFNDIDDNHVGIDISSLISSVSHTAAYYKYSTKKDDNHYSSISLKISGNPFQAWVDYNSQEMVVNVSISPLGMPMPYWPLISFPIDISTVIDDYMYVGFSAATGVLAGTHNVHGWSFRIGGSAQDLNPKKLPYPRERSQKGVGGKGFVFGLTSAGITIVPFVIFGALLLRRRIRSKGEILEDWEVEYGAHRFKHSELCSATDGFPESNLIGSGGFGRVYKGVIPSNGMQVAIMRIANYSRQGMKEFVAEITSMGCLRHRNLVQLHGWCRRQDELLLVYDYVPNGSLDKLLFDGDHQKKTTLTWEQRFKILKGVAQALLNLHEESDQRVVHRDVKPSNVLIDESLNAKLGDFGLARTYRHGLNPQTTHVVGTLGYIAPELTRTGKATTSADVYGYGILILEEACGRRPIESEKTPEELLLVDWIRELHSQGEIMRAVDPALEEYDPDEVKLIPSLGLLCSRPHPEHRPSMRRVVQILAGDASLPPLPPDINLEEECKVTEFSDSFTDSSDPSRYRSDPPFTDSFNTMDENVSGSQITTVTF